MEASESPGRTWYWRQLMALLVGGLASTSLPWHLSGKGGTFTFCATAPPGGQKEGRVSLLNPPRARPRRAARVGEVVGRPFPACCPLTPM